MAKRLMYLNRRAPHGSVYAAESLEVVLIGAAFDQQVCMAFVDDGVFQLLEGQDTSAIGIKNFTRAFKALGDYDVTELYVEQESLTERGLSAADLMSITYEDEDDDWNEKPSMQIVSRAQMAQLLEAQDVVFNF